MSAVRLADKEFFGQGDDYWPLCRKDGAKLVYPYQYEPEYSHDPGAEAWWYVYFRCPKCGQKYYYFDKGGNYYVDDIGLHGPYIDDGELMSVDNKRFERSLRASAAKKYSYPNNNFLT